MRGVHFFMILVAIPTIAALGHDIYLFYTDNGMASIAADINSSIEQKGALSMFASLGFIWTQYSPESYTWAIENLSQGHWEIINSLLTEKAVFAGILFAFFFYIILFVQRLLGIWPFNEAKLSKFPSKKKNQFKYNRK